MSRDSQSLNAQPIWQFIILSIFTFGIYHYYWFYRNWKQLKKYHNLNLNPGWRTFGLFIPILNIVLVYNQIRNISTFVNESNCSSSYSYSPEWVAIYYFVISALPIAKIQSDLAVTTPITTGLFLLGIAFAFFHTILLAVVQGVLNSYWTQENNKIMNF